MIKNEDCSPLMTCETDSTCSSESKKYKRIKSDTKNLLLEKIFFGNQRIKKAAKELNINYSSAKTILYLHRKKARRNLVYAKNHEGNRCFFRNLQENEDHKLIVVTLQAGRLISEHKESLLKKKITKSPSSCSLNSMITPNKKINTYQGYPSDSKLNKSIKKPIVVVLQNSKALD